MMPESSAARILGKRKTSFQSNLQAGHRNHLYPKMVPVETKTPACHRRSTRPNQKRIAAVIPYLYGRILKYNSINLSYAYCSISPFDSENIWMLLEATIDLVFSIQRHFTGI